ncbi:MAG TPA: signal peptide peptidase SppA [Chitinophagaceae bacterium]|nr:signal peptide peptidase SppA [Chitinophagaceae bacterium]
MGNFFKIFFASFLALIVFCLIGFFLVAALISGLASKEKPDVSKQSVLVLDLSQQFKEQKQEGLLGNFASMDEGAPGLYDVVRLIAHAKSDDNVSGIYIQANDNANGFATSDEIRRALLDFKSSKKFIIAHGDIVSQKAYFIANVADKIYANPVGVVDWSGFSSELIFVKGMLDKLQIEPQIFYAGKFKSATEPLRTDKMTPENKLQTSIWLNNLYNYFLVRTSESRKIDTATLHNLANTAAIQKSEDAVTHKLIDGIKYDDEVKDEIKKRLNIGKYDKLNLLPMNDYADAASIRKTGKDRIGIIYAEGDIVDGEGTADNIGGDNFRRIVRKMRLDKSIKAIVLRINSGGGSALASENIWRELSLAKGEKPVVVSFGDVAASGGYYIGCGADSIFALPNTITGSIGVFGIIPNMQGFFNNKLGVTFDGVKTATYADAGALYRPMNEAEKKIVQQSVDRIYMQFKQRVAQGRKKGIEFVDSIAQGRVWSGEDALRIGLVDKMGNLQTAIDCAARLAKVSDYSLREYPQTKSWFEDFLKTTKESPQAMIKKEIGEKNFTVYQQLMQVQQMCGSVQARLPFSFIVH